MDVEWFDVGPSADLFSCGSRTGFSDLACSETFLIAWSKSRCCAGSCWWFISGWKTRGCRTHFFACLRRMISLFRIGPTLPCFRAKATRWRPGRVGGAREVAGTRGAPHGPGVLSLSRRGAPLVL